MLGGTLRNVASTRMNRMRPVYSVARMIDCEGRPPARSFMTHRHLGDHQPLTRGQDDGLDRVAQELDRVVLGEQLRSRAGRDAEARGDIRQAGFARIADTTQAMMRCTLRRAQVDSKVPPPAKRLPITMSAEPIAPRSAGRNSGRC